MSQAGIPSALAGQIVHAINGQPCIEATRFGVSLPKPLKQRYGFAGLIGTSEGQAGIQIRLTFASPAAKSQFNLIAMAALRAGGREGFYYDFWEGEVGISNHWLVTNCFVGSFDMTNDPEAGDTEKTVTMIGAYPVPIP